MSATSAGPAASGPQPVVLVIDDEKNIRRSIEIALEQEGLRVLAAHDPAHALRTLTERVVDLAILDIRLGGMDGLELYRAMRARGLDVPTIFISGHATLTQTAEAIKGGGYDFLEKPFTAEKLLVTVRRCLELTRLQERLRVAEAQLKTTGIIGDSPAIRQLIADALKVAESDAGVLISGESGVGKELVASTIHNHSRRRAASLVTVNCSAIPESLIESELFGHERGAFTGATASRKGHFELAHRGTIFLDEIGDLSLGAQAKILRVLQSGEIQKIGADRPTSVDVRVICASHKDLKRMAAEGAFREDLFYRLNVVPLRVPSLRERRDDIPLLVRVLAERHCARHNLRPKRIDDEVVAELQRYQWPGNIRELANVLERMLIMSGERVGIADLPEEIGGGAEEPTAPGGASLLKEFRDQAERDFIIATLRKHGGNVSQTALELGVRRTYLHRRFVVLNIAKKDYFG
jgi:two-component system nitrogen regulation response regulator NtrX